MNRERTVRLWSVVCLTVASALLPLGSARAQQDPWQEFLDDRVSLYQQLAPPFVECFQRRDSAVDPLSPIFHGCIDWHSAVHAAYSHHVLYRRTGDRTFLDLANDQIEPNGASLVPAELAYEQAKGIDVPLTENPYGFGWFLVLAREREESTGRTDLREMADHAASELLAWFQARAVRGDARTFILDEAHSNYSWSLINLDAWARYTNDARLLAGARDATGPLFASSLDTSCPTTRDRAPNRSGFQPACLMRLAAVAHVWGDHVRDWVLARLPAEGMNIEPVTDPANCHAGGLNFARAFALYQLYRVTGDPGYRDNYADLVRYHVGRPDLYIDPDYLGSPGYLCYSHWVAQFGVRTISLSYEEPPPTPALPPPADATAVTVDEAVVAGSEVAVTGSSAFADQPFVQLGTDPSGDADLPGDVGQDLTSAAAATSTDGRLHLRFGLASLPPGTGQGPRVSYGWAFCLDETGCFEVEAWSIGTSWHRPVVEVRRCADPSCAPDSQTPVDAGATAIVNGTARTVAVHVPLEALGAAPGATLEPAGPAGAPVATGVGASRTAGDQLAYEGEFRTGVREVSLAVGPRGQDPGAVTYGSTVEAGAGGGYSADLDASGLPPGPATVYARACFGTGNCGYATRDITL